MIKNVSNQEDIINEVAKRTGVDKEKITFIFNFLFSHIKKLTKKRDILTIFIPHLGRLYQKHGYLKREEGKLGGKEDLSRGEAIRLSRSKDKLQILEENSEAGTSKLKNHYTKPKLKNTYLTTRKTTEELEQFQNEEEK